MLNPIGQGCTEPGNLPPGATCPLVKLECFNDEPIYRGKHAATECVVDNVPSCALNGKLYDVGLKRRRLGETWEDPNLPTMFQTCPKLGTAGLLSPSDPQRTARTGRSFLTIRHNSSIFHTEEWKPRGCTMYLPLAQDIMINTRNVDQLSFENDQFFLADDKGNYIGAKTGNAIHLWRYDTSTKRLFISQSVLFLREQVRLKQRLFLNTGGALALHIWLWVA